MTTFGFPVYTPADIASWSDGSPWMTNQYNRLASTFVGNANRTIENVGTSITTVTEKTSVNTNSVYAKGAAVMYQVDGSAARRAKVVEALNNVAQVTVLSTPSGVAQDGLEASWWLTNYCQAAKLVDYANASGANVSGFNNFCRSVVYPILDWTQGGNWHMTHSASRLTIAAWLGAYGNGGTDLALWDDAKAFFYFRLPQTIYHSDYDGGSVVPMRNNNWPATQTASVNAARTVQHWAGSGSQPQITTNLLAVSSWTDEPAYPQGTPFPDGTDAERRRDFGHESMSLAGMTQAARTILAQGDTLPQHVIDRITAFADYFGGRVLSFVNSGGSSGGTSPPPVPLQNGTSGGGPAPPGENYRKGWFGVIRLLRNNTPQNVLDLVQTSTITDAPTPGVNHMTAEMLADGPNEVTDVDETAEAGVAIGTGVALSPLRNVGPVARVGIGIGLTDSPVQVQTSANRSAPASPALATGTAFVPTRTTTTAARHASATGAAFPPLANTTSLNNVAARLASAIGAAFTPTIDSSTPGFASPATSLAIGTAHTPTISIIAEDTANPGAATATGTALTPTILSSSAPVSPPFTDQFFIQTKLLSTSHYAARLLDT